MIAQAIKNLQCGLAAIALSLGLNVSAAENSPSIEGVSEKIAALKILETTARIGEGSQEDAIDKIGNAYRELIEKNPDDPEVAAAYADFLLGFHGARKAYAYIESLEPPANRSPTLLMIKGEIELRRGNPVDAERSFRAATDIDKKSARAYFALANIQFLFRHDLRERYQLGEEEIVGHALDNYKKSVEIEPTNIRMARGYAETFFAVDPPRWREAADAWEHVYEISPDKDFARINLATVMLKLGDLEKAVEYLDAVLSDRFNGRIQKLRKRIREAQEEN